LTPPVPSHDPAAAAAETEPVTRLLLEALARSDKCGAWSAGLNPTARNARVLPGVLHQILWKLANPA